MNSAATVDVIIPVRNGEKYIAEALASVVSQTYRVQSVIVVNDGSTDRTEEIVLGFKARSAINIVYVKNPGSGRSAARNCGLKTATARYVAFLDADDVWLPEKLAEQVKIFERADFPSLGVVYCDQRVIDDKSLEVAPAGVLHPSEAVRGDVFSKLLEGNLVCGSSSAVLAERACFEETGYFDETLHAAEDWDMWLRLAGKFQFDYAMLPLVKIRVHGGNTQKDHGHMVDNEVRFFNKWSKYFDARIWGIWGRSLMLRIVNDLPEMDCYRKVKANFPESSRKKLFAACLGSMELYFAAATVFIFTKRAIRSLLSAGRTSARGRAV